MAKRDIVGVADGLWTAVWVDEFGNFTRRTYSRCPSLDVVAAQVAKDIRGMPRSGPLLFRGEAVEVVNTSAYANALRPMVKT